MLGAKVALMSFNNLDINLEDFNFVNNKSYVYEEKKYYTNQYYQLNQLNQLNQSPDIIWFDTISFRNDIISNINLKKIKNFEINIGNSSIFNIDFNLLKNMSKVYEKDGYIFIVIDINTFFLDNNDEGIPFIRLKHQNVFFKITTINSDLQYEFNILFQNIYLSEDNKENNKNYTKSIDYKIIEYSKYGDIYTNDIHDTFSKMKDFYIGYNSGISSGFFIKTNKKLRQISLVLNGVDFFNYNYKMIHNYEMAKIYFDNKETMILHKYLLEKLPSEIIEHIISFIDDYNFIYWFPFVKNKKYNSSNYVGSINFSNIDTSYISIPSDIKCEVIIPSYNILRIHNGDVTNLFSLI